MRLGRYPFSGTKIAAKPSAEGRSSTQHWPGGILALLANGDQAGSGVLWARVVANNGDTENNPPAPRALYAFDAENVENELWNSTINPSRDSYGNCAKFVPPLIGNGKVYRHLVESVGRFMGYCGNPAVGLQRCYSWR